MDERPKPAIVHLALWATVTSIYLAPIVSSGELRQGFASAFRVVAIVVFAGVAISGAIVVATRLVRGKRWSTAPGEWLVFVLGVVLAVDALMRRWPEHAIVPGEMIVRCAACLATVVPTLSRRLSWTWKIYFMWMVFAQFAVVAISFGVANGNPGPTGAISSIRYSCAVTIPLIFAIWERKEGFGWLHWLGIGLNSIWHAYWIYSLT